MDISLSNKGYKSISITLGDGRDIYLYSSECALPFDVCSLQYEVKKPTPDKVQSVSMSSDSEMGMTQKSLVTEYEHHIGSVTKEEALQGIGKTINYIKCLVTPSKFPRKDIDFLRSIYESSSTDSISDILVNSAGSVHDGNLLKCKNGTAQMMSSEGRYRQNGLVEAPLHENMDRPEEFVSSVHETFAKEIAVSIDDIHANIKAQYSDDEPTNVEQNYLIPETQMIPSLKKILGRKKIRCSECTKTFSKDSTFAAHMRMHAGQHPFKCKVCGKGYHTRVGYKMHMLQHTDKIFQCEKCGKNFKTPGNLYTHMRSHDDVKRYVCPVCGKRSSTSSHNLTHMQIHSNDRRYKCDTCDKAFNASSDLRRHKRRVHPDCI